MGLAATLPLSGTTTAGPAGLGGRVVVAGAPVGALGREARAVPGHTQWPASQMRASLQSRSDRPAPSDLGGGQAGTTRGTAAATARTTLAHLTRHHHRPRFSKASTRLGQ